MSNVFKTAANSPVSEGAEQGSQQEQPGRGLQERFERHLSKKEKEKGKDKRSDESSDDSSSNLALLMSMMPSPMLLQSMRDASALAARGETGVGTIDKKQAAREAEAPSAQQLAAQALTPAKTETWQGRVTNGQWAGVELHVAQHAGRLMLTARAANEKQYQRLLEVKKTIDVELKTLFDGGVSLEVTREHR
jgi:hypothetical protein